MCILIYILPLSMHLDVDHKTPASFGLVMCLHIIYPKCHPPRMARPSISGHGRAGAGRDRWHVRQSLLQGWRCREMEVSINFGVPQKGSFLVGNPIGTDDFGVPRILGHPQIGMAIIQLLGRTKATWVNLSENWGIEALNNLPILLVVYPFLVLC